MAHFPESWTNAQEWQDCYPISVEAYCQEHGIIDVREKWRTDILFLNEKFRPGMSRKQKITALQGLSANQIPVEEIEAVLNKRTFYDNEVEAMNWLDEQRRAWYRAMDVALFDHYIKPLGLGTCTLTEWHALLLRARAFGWEARERENAAAAIAAFITALVRPKDATEAVL